MYKAGPENGFLRGSGSGYSRGVKFVLPTAMGFKPGTVFLIQAKPWNTSHKFMRLEWNPTLVGKKGLNYLHSQLFSEFMPDWRERIQANGYVTRYDLAMDLLGIKVDDLIVWSKKVRVYGMFTNSSGATETLYIGKNESNQLVVYDRMAHMKKANKSAHLLEKKEIPAKHLTRIEARRRLSMPVSSLLGVPNPFEYVEVFQPTPAALTMNSEQFALFRNACQMRGYRRALKLMPEYKQQTYNELMMSCRAKWWTPEATWSYWPEALKKAGVPIHPPQ